MTASSGNHGIGVATDALPTFSDGTAGGLDDDTITFDICAIAMRLADGEMDVRLGPDPAGSWQTHTV